MAWTDNKCAFRSAPFANFSGQKWHFMFMNILHMLIHVLLCQKLAGHNWQFIAWTDDKSLFFFVLSF